MKKLLFTAAMLAVPAVAGAQTVSGSISAGVSVPTTLDFGLVVISPFDFGTVTANNTPTPSRTGSISLYRNVGITLSLPDGTATGRMYRGGVKTASYLQPSFSACGVGTTPTTITSSFSSCTPASANTAVLTLPDPGGPTNEYVIFTGTLTAPTTTEGGTYTGSITVQAVAN